MLIKIITIVNWSILGYFVLLSTGYIVLFIASIPEIYLRFKENEVVDISLLMKSYSLPPVTVIVPAYNEAPNILETIESILKNSYKNTNVLIINSGSTDKTVEKLVEQYSLEEVKPLLRFKINTASKIKGYYISKTYKNIVLINTERMDRSDTLNIGINASRTSLYMTVDADTLMEPDAVSNILFYMLSQPNMIAVGGAVFILNGCMFKDGEITDTKLSTNPIYTFQICEYLRSFYFSKVGWNTFGGALCYAGAFTLFNKEAAVKIGGYMVGNPAQDFEIITHLHAHYRKRKLAYRVGYTPSAAVWTDVPGTLKEYWFQRYNWQYGILQSLIPYKKMLFNPKYGILGFFTYPFFLLGETLGVCVEFLAYLSLIISWYLGILNSYWMILFFILCWGFSILLTIATSLLSFTTFKRYKLKFLLWIFIFSVIEIFGFRQFNVLCRTSATIVFFYRKMKKRIKKAVTYIKFKG